MLPVSPRRWTPSLLAVALMGPALLTALHVEDAMAQGQPVFSAPFVQLLPTGPLQADGVTPATLHVVMLAPDGSPYVGVQPKVTAKDGRVADWTDLGGGLYSFTYVPPRQSGDGATTVSVKGRTPDKLTLDSTFSLKLAAPLPSSMTITASAPELVLGQDPSLNLTFQLGGGAGQPEVGARLRAMASTGTVENLTYLGGGMFTARYTPTAEAFPRLAIITVVDERSPDTLYGTIALRLVGKTDFPVTVQPGATAIVRVGDRDFGPYTADATGRAVVPIVVPPGVTEATLVSVVGGARAESPLPLMVPERPRLSFFPTFAAVAGDARGVVTLRVAVTTRTGLPDTSAQLNLSATNGTVGPVTHEGNGVYAAQFTPNPAPAGGAAVVTATIAGDPGNLSAQLNVPLAPARPATVTHRAEPDKLAQGVSSFRVFSRVTGADGVGLGDRELVFVANGAQVQGAPRDLRSGDYETAFTATGADSVLLTGTVGMPVTGNPLRHVVLVPAAERLANDGATVVGITVLTVDAFGYPVPGTVVNLKLEAGDGDLTRQVTTDGRGMARVFYTAGSAATVVNVKATAGDVSGQVGLLQLPKGVAPGLDLPSSGDAATVAVNTRLQGTTPSLMVARAGASGVAQATPVASGVGPLAQISASAQPGMAAPGGSVELTIRPTDASGALVPGEKIQVLATGATATPPVPRGDGTLVSTLTVAPSASGQVMVIVSNANGSVTGAVTVPINAPAWGATTQPTQPVVTQPVVTQPVVTQPVTTTTTTATTTSTGTIEPPREPGAFPKLRVRAGFALGSYGYRQAPEAVDSPLWPDAVNVTAMPVGFTVDARGWLPMFEYVGAEVSARGGFYAVDWLGDGTAIINDVLPQVNVMAMGRYPIDLAGGSRVSVGGKVGLLYGDFITYQQPGPDELTWEALPLAGLGLGAELGYELSDRLHVEADYVLGLRGSPFSHSVGVDLGVGITGPLTINAGFNWSTRTTEVVSGGSGALLGTLSDTVIMGSIGPGLQF